jgi:hypothetical protein
MDPRAIRPLWTGSGRLGSGVRLRCVSLGRPFASGREADVYALGDGRVLRRYREHGGCEHEAQAMRYVHELGYPVPVVFEASGPDHALPPWPGADGPSVVHLDLHPENVLMTARGPVVIDWRNASGGEGDLDTAMTALILAEVAHWDHPLAAVARDGLADFLATAPGDPRRLVAEVARRRRGQVHTLSEDERRNIDRAVRMVQQ